MISFAAVAQYIEAVEGLKHRLREPYVLAAVYDEFHTPLYRVKNGALFFDVIDKKANSKLSLVLFPNRRAQDLFARKHPKCEIIVAGLFVSVDNANGVWVDMAIMQRCENKGQQSESKSDARLLTEGRRAFVGENGKWGYLDSSDLVSIEPQWDNVDDFYEGRAVVEANDYYGVIDTNGRIVIALDYDELSWDGSQYAYAEKEFLWGVIDRMGTVVVPFEWDWIGEFEQGFLLVQRDGKYGYMNSEGELVLDLQYDNGTSFNEYGFASVTVGESEFQISPDGKRV